MDLNHVKSLFGHRVVIPASRVAASAGTGTKLVAMVQPTSAAAGASSAAFVPVPRTTGTASSTTATAKNPATSTTSASTYSTSGVSSIAYRYVPTNPNFYQPLPRPDGFRIQAVNPNFRRPETANIVRPDGSFHEGSSSSTSTTASAQASSSGAGTTTSAAPGTASAKAATTAAPAGADATAANNSAVDLKDPALYSKFDYQMQKCLGLEDCNLSCCFWTPKKIVLHDQQEGCTLRYTDRAFLMRNVHQEALQKSARLGHALQASWVMRNMHDKSCILPDPDYIFAFDIDADGFPTHDVNGEELTKNQYKKVRKLIEGERKKQAKKK
ncbi:unnamed protein product [Amoebophrya sp. A120]|nr:unnamed protein product [Amoebophrya sp. A120]|eukprot:GSA120T00000368001.1